MRRDIHLDLMNGLWTYYVLLKKGDDTSILEIKTPYIFRNNENQLKQLINRCRKKRHFFI